MRKGFEGLYGLVRDQLGLDPLSGHLCLFCNKERNRIKVLYWDGAGLWVCAKRLEKGRFSWPSALSGTETKVLLSQEELALTWGNRSEPDTAKSVVSARGTSGRKSCIKASN